MMVLAQPYRRAPAGLLFFMPILFVSAGCIEHHARVVPSAPIADPGPAPVLIAHRVRDPLTVPDESRDALPIDLPVSAYRRDADGRLWRYEGRATTPLSWSQRFPFDAVMDVLPTTFTYDAESTVVFAPVAAADENGFLDQARRDGYAREPAKP